MYYEACFLIGWNEHPHRPFWDQIGQPCFRCLNDVCPCREVPSSGPSVTRVRSANLIHCFSRLFFASKDIVTGTPDPTRHQRTHSPEY